jgi:hypothetical protein
MPAIITDQFRISNAQRFVESVRLQEKTYYFFVGLPNSTDYDPDWEENPPFPRDNFYSEYSIWDSMLSLKKLSTDDVRQVVRKNLWSSGTTYDMYRHNISVDYPADRTGSPSLYSSDFYIMNSDYRVYICLFNGKNPENPNGRPSLDEPTFVDLEPREAGSSGDGYIWKYLFTINPKDIVKFDSTDFIPVPVDWFTNNNYTAVRENAETSGQIKTVTIKNRGVGMGPANRVYTKVPIKGDGIGAEATITINNDSKIESVTISNGGSGYTYGILDLVAGSVPTGTIDPEFEVIIPPPGGHGADIYKELGATNVLLYCRLDNDLDTPDFILGNQIAQIGIIEDPLHYNSSQVLTLSKASAVGALKLVGNGYDTLTFPADSFIEQTIGIGSTSIGRVVSYDQRTGVLKYWQDKSMSGFNTDGSQNLSFSNGYTLHKFTSKVDDISTQLFIRGQNTNALQIDVNFGTTSNPGITTIINSIPYSLGQNFVEGVAEPEVKKYSGKLVYVDNRSSITRSTTQKEDIKVILQF